MQITMDMAEEQARFTNNKPKLFKKFKEFLADECFDLKEYKAGKYDRKIFNWFMKVSKT